MEQISQVFAGIKQQFGRLDILINNAATNPQFCNVLDTDLSAFQKTVDVNIRGYFFMSVEAGKLMRENGGGSIINVASINGVSPGIFQGIYSVTKAAVINMTKVFAKECVQFGIRCNALLPGLTDTKFASALVKNEAILNTALQRIPLKRVADPSEMAGGGAVFGQRCVELYDWGFVECGWGVPVLMRFTGLTKNDSVRGNAIGANRVPLVQLSTNRSRLNVNQVGCP
ncbi:hypothetical protein EMIT0196MI5_100130 [Pseudomonas sp. IT-196MI5]